MLYTTFFKILSMSIDVLINCELSAAVQNQKAVFVYLKSKQTLPFGFAEHA